MTDQERFDELVEEMNRHSGLDESLKVYAKTRDADSKITARKNLQTLINNTLPEAGINIRTPDGLINEYGVRVRDRMFRKGGEKLRENPGVIDYALGEHADNFKERYLAIRPFGIEGDDEHNEIAGNHDRFYKIAEALREYSIETHEDFVREISEYLRASLQETLGENDDPEGLGQLVLEAFYTASPSEAKETAGSIATASKRKIDELLPEDNRAEYVAKTLRARVNFEGDNQGIVYSNAAKDLYRVVA